MLFYVGLAVPRFKTSYDSYPWQADDKLLSSTTQYNTVAAWNYGYRNSQNAILHCGHTFLTARAGCKIRFYERPNSRSETTIDGWSRTGKSFPVKRKILLPSRNFFKLYFMHPPWAVFCYSILFAYTNPPKYQAGSTFSQDWPPTTSIFALFWHELVTLWLRVRPKSPNSVYSVECRL